MKKGKIKEYQFKVLKSLAGKADEFYLAGGTALSLFYFQHRESIDLDFFTDNFSEKRVREIAAYLGEAFKKKIELAGRNLDKKYVRILVYNIHFTAKDVLKIDFVEDMTELIKPTRLVEGIRILSLEDIYLRKLYAVSGTVSGIDEAGRRKFAGGRVEAKDFFDLYFLSSTFMSLSKFVSRYGSALMIEGIIKWFRSYDRMEMTDGALSLETDKAIDYKKMERHFKIEIDKIIESRLDEI